MKVLSILFLFLIPYSLTAQEVQNQVVDSTKDIIRTKYTQIDKLSKGFSPLFGNTSKKVQFVLVQLVNITTSEKIYGVEVSVESNKVEVTKSSLSFAHIGSLWGSSTEMTFRNIQNEGFILMTQNDLNNVIEFFNNNISAIANSKSDNYKIYKLTLYNRFEFGLLFDKKWKFVLSVDDATYTLNYQEGIDIIKELNKFKTYIEEQQQ